MRTFSKNLISGAAVVCALIIASLQTQSQVGVPQPGPSTNIVETVLAATRTGALTFRLTTPAELKALLGPAEKEHTEKRGDESALVIEYPDAQVTFRRLGESPPYTLFQVVVDDSPVDIGRERMIEARNVADLGKFDSFWGLANISLSRLDLSDQMPRLGQLPFDSRTQWPPADKLPKGFNPAKILAEGKNPGLGVRKLHAQGIDGRGIHIAIIDQPLLREHQEYRDQVLEYHEIEIQGVPPQMHGSPVTSIAVGKACGTAPGALVHYYAVPTWSWVDQHCKPYAAVVEQIVERNKPLAAAQKVRVVSLSLGMFSQWPDHELWTDAVKHARAAGILVVTCDPVDYRLAILKRQSDLDPELATSYMNQFGLGQHDALGVPAGNRTTASHTGAEDYIFWRQGGMSWTVPYLAGLAALAYQIDPQLDPQAIPGLWQRTATKTAGGLVVNSAAFLDAVRNGKVAFTR